MNNYLIISSSSRQINKKLKGLINFNDETIYFNLSINTILDVIEEGSYNSLFNDKKNIIVYNASCFSNNNLNKDDTEIVSKFLKNDNELTKIVFVTSDKENKNNELYKTIDSKNIFNLEKSKEDINNLIISYCKENHYTINKDALFSLKESALNKSDIILNELDKIFLYYSEPQEITLDVVKTVCSNNIEDNNFKFTDAVIAKHYKNSFKLLKDMKILKIEPFSVFSLLVREFRLMLLYSLIKNKKGSFEEFMKTYNLRDWQLDKISRNAANYKINELKRIISILADYDYKYKSGKIDKDILLDLLLIEIFRN